MFFKNYGLFNKKFIFLFFYLIIIKIFDFKNT